MRRWTVTAAMAMATDTTHFTGGDVANDQLLLYCKKACKASETVQTMLVAEAAHANLTTRAASPSATVLPTPFQDYPARTVKKVWPL
jgi:hypothetical protein